MQWSRRARYRGWRARSVDHKVVVSACVDLVEERQPARRCGGYRRSRGCRRCRGCGGRRRWRSRWGRWRRSRWGWWRGRRGCCGSHHVVVVPFSVDLGQKRKCARGSRWWRRRRRWRSAGRRRRRRTRVGKRRRRLRHGRRSVGRRRVDRTHRAGFEVAPLGGARWRHLERGRGRRGHWGSH